MSEIDPRQQELISWLKEQGHTPAEVEQILAKVAQYDQQTLHESIFDSIDRGDFNLGKIIEEALGEESP